MIEIVLVRIPAEDFSGHNAVGDQGGIECPLAVSAGEAFLVEDPIVGGHLFCLEDLSLAFRTAGRISGLRHDGGRIHNSTRQSIFVSGTILALRTNIAGGSGPCPRPGATPSPSGENAEFLLVAEAAVDLSIRAAVALAHVKVGRALLTEEAGRVEGTHRSFHLLSLKDLAIATGTSGQVSLWCHDDLV